MSDSPDNETIKNNAENENNVESIETEDKTEILGDIKDIVPTAEDEDETFHYEPKLSPKQQKILQIIIGLFCGFLVWFTLGLGTVDRDNSLFRWLFLIVFVVIMIAKNQIEKRTGIIMHTFMKFFLIGLIIFLGVYLIYGATQGMFDQAFVQQ